ncbi:hypothetical protein CRG98_041628 [Punica granatum]|uniref:Uncharacterized protein n=1 Tax=Punica granatum TaxID=22663 RepID=A0A2I0I3G5_PUNGR|nr:hypothetical protein CRG98_041628 [Punica granatum]
MRQNERSNGPAGIWTGPHWASGPDWAGEPLDWDAKIWTGPLDLDWSTRSGSGCYLRWPGEELTRLAKKRNNGEEGIRFGAARGELEAGRGAKGVEARGSGRVPGWGVRTSRRRSR